MSDEWRPPLPDHLNHDQFEPLNDLSPEDEAYYEGARMGDEHAARMAQMGVAERNRYMKGLREAVNGGRPPRRGDLDNPLKRDGPKPAPTPKPAPKQKAPAKKEPWYSEKNLRNIQKAINKSIALHNKANGGKRR
jgi:hypothetical protein